MPDLQEALAVAIVLLVVAIGLWRRWRRRASRGTCGDCDASSGAKTKEVPLRFYRRKP